MPASYEFHIVFAYEFRMITRSWVYRLMVPVVPGAVILFAATIYLNPQRTWDWFALPATLPYLATLTATVLLSFVGAFLGTDLVHRDRILNTIQSLHARPVVNPSFVIGKLLALVATLGIIEVFALIATLVVNLFAHELPVQWEAYLLYPLLMTLPALTFISGLSFTLAALTGSTAVASLVAWVTIVISAAVPFTSLSNLPDLTGFHIPLIYSDIAGFGNLPVLIIQRSIFLILGMGLVSVSVFVFPRLSARRLQWAGIMAVVFVLIGFLFGTTFIITSHTGAVLRERIRTLNERYAATPAVTVTDCDLDVTHRGSSIRATVGLTIINATNAWINSYLFSLNPGLKIESVTDSDKSLEFHRDLHILDITPPSPLGPGDTDTVEIVYHGVIEEDACYTDIGEDTRMLPYGFLCCDIAKRYAFVGPDFVLLTPEALWYPITGVPFGALFPAAQNRDFVDFSLTVTADDRLTTLSQGAATTVSPGITRFAPETPLPGLSLVIGEYEPLSTIVDGIEYTVWLKHGHDLFSEHFEELRGDALTEWIRNYKAGFEAPFEGTYPYRRFALVEVPVQFYAYPRLWSGEMQTVQPEMVFLPEKGYSAFDSYYGDFSALSTDANNRFSEQSTSEEREDYMLTRFLTNTVHHVNFGYDVLYHGESEGLLLNKTRANELSYGLLAPYSLFQVHMISDTSPVFTSFLERCIEYFIWGTDTSVNRVSSHFLADKSLEMLLNDPANHKVSRVVLKAKADEFFAVLETTVSEDSLRATLRDFIDQHRFSSIGFDSLASLFNERFAIDLEKEIHDWYTSVGLPGYVVTDERTQRIEQDDRTFHQVSFTIHNLESSPGIVTIQGIESNKLREGNWSTYTTYLSGKQSKEICMVFDDSPLVQYDVYTFLSKNMPNRISGISRTDDDSIKGTITPGERIISEQYMYEKPGEVIIDNEDPGFEIVRSHPRWRFIRSLFTSPNTPVIVPYTFFGYDYNYYPEWRYIQGSNLFGLYAKTAYMISGGHGETAVRWTADLPEDGEYDVYYYSYYFDLNEIFNDVMFESYGISHLKGIPTIGDYHFIVHSAGGPEGVVLNMPTFNKQVFPMEAHLGTFTFDKGAAVIELTDETKGAYVFADAVKWVKR